MSPDTPAWIRWLRILFVGTLALQGAIVLASVAVGHANAGAGMMRYRLPGLAFWVYAWTAVGAPGAALATLVVIWARKLSPRHAAADSAPRAVWHLVALCIANVVAVAAWFGFGGLVFFAAGGNR